MPGRECKFCKNNGETTQMYRSHSLRNPSDGRLICPVLRDHVCELCGATGDGAHTRCAAAIICFVQGLHQYSILMVDHGIVVVGLYA